MHRIDSATASPDENGAGKDGFTEGDPGMGVPPTALTAPWFNDAQEELCNLIEAMGITLVKGTQTQLLAALRSPVGSGTGAAIHGTGGGTSGPGLKGTGGASNGMGVQGQGTGTGSGGEFTGGATSGAKGLIATGTGSGAGIQATGGASSGNGGTFTGGASNGAGCVGVGTGTGAGGTFTGTAGYGAVIESDATSPAKAALHIGPQDAEPSTAPTVGDMAVIGVKPVMHNGTTFDRFVMQAAAPVGTSSSTATTSRTAFGAKYTIPASTLKAGSTVRVWAMTKVGSAAGGGTVAFDVAIGGTAVVLSSTRTCVVDEVCILEAVLKVEAAPGASVQIFGGGTAQHGAEAAAVDTRLGYVSTNKATNGALDVEVYYDLSNTSDVIELISLVVDVL